MLSKQKELNQKLKLEKSIQDFWLKRSRQWVTTSVDFILIGLPLVAPIPNLINLAIALTPVMGYIPAILAAIAFELLLFGSAEIVLYLQDKQLRHGGYELPLKIAVFCGCALITILLILIAWYEVPLHGYAVLTLPFVSVISIAFLSLKKYVDIRDTIIEDDNQQIQTIKELENTVFNLDKTNAELQKQIVEMSAQLDKTENDFVQIRTNNDIENRQNESAFLGISTNLSENGQVDIMNNARIGQITERQNKIVQMANGQNVKDFINLCEAELNFSKRTIKRDLDKLANSNILYVNGIVKRLE